MTTGCVGRADENGRARSRRHRRLHRRRGAFALLPRILVLDAGKFTTRRRESGGGDAIAGVSDGLAAPDRVNRASGSFPGGGLCAA
jgi:hypothetical protein